MTTPAASPVYASKISLALQSARACALREQDHYQRNRLLAEIVGIQVRVGDWDGANREVMSEEARKDDDLKASMFAEMASAQISLGDCSGALSTIRQALVLGFDGFAFFLTLYRLAGIEGRIADEITEKEALDLVEGTTAEQLTKEKVPGFILLTCLTWLAHVQAIGGKREKADHTLQSALDLVSSDAFDLIHRPQVMDGGYADIVAVQARIGDIPGALKTLERMSDRGRIENGMPRIAVELADSGDLAGALAFVALIDEVGPKTDALLGIAQMQARHGDSTGAKNTLARITSSTDKSTRSENAEGMLYIALTKAEVQRGDRDNAPRALAELLHIVDEAQLNMWMTREVHTAVGKAYAALGMVEEALRIFERVISDRDALASRDSLARMSTKAHTVAGNVEVAEAWVQTLPIASEQYGAWLGIVDGITSLSIEG